MTLWILFSILALFGVGLSIKALSANTPVVTDEGEFSSFGVLANAVIYEGSMVGSSSGYARPLTAGDQFLGHAWAAVTGTAANGGVECRVRTGKYRLVVTLASIAVTDVGKPVYASDDGTLTLTQSTNSRVGKVARYVTTNTCVVEFEAPAKLNAALTTALTTLDVTALTQTADYIPQALTASSPVGFVTAGEGETVVKCVKNCQTRIGEIETILKSNGLLA